MTRIRDAAPEPTLSFDVMRDRQWIILQFTLGEAHGHRDHHSVRLLAADYEGQSDEAILASQRHVLKHWHAKHEPKHREILRRAWNASWRSRVHRRRSARAAARLERRRRKMDLGGH